MMGFRKGFSSQWVPVVFEMDPRVAFAKVAEYITCGLYVIYCRIAATAGLKCGNSLAVCLALCSVLGKGN